MPDSGLARIYGSSSFKSAASSSSQGTSENKSFYFTFPPTVVMVRCLLSPPTFNTPLEVLESSVRPEKEIRGIRIGKKEINLSLFVNGMIAYVENSKESKNKTEQKNL